VPLITGLLETSLYVSDLERSRDFYHGLFEFPIVAEGQRLTALAVGPAQLLLLCRKGASTGLGRTAHDGDGQLHVAFSVAEAELPAWEERLAKRGIDVVERRGWDRGGRSVYFRDPDGHLLELATPGVWPNY
jgi:catechol 2,3-dioxygenase-like lactoylglutathione lyase family enzyme